MTKSRAVATAVATAAPCNARFLASFAQQSTVILRSPASLGAVLSLRKALNR